LVAWCPAIVFGSSTSPIYNVGKIS
jgi:hypothetical protein